LNEQHHQGEVCPVRLGGRSEIEKENVAVVDELNFERPLSNIAIASDWEEEVTSRGGVGWLSDFDKSLSRVL